MNSQKKCIVHIPYKLKTTQESGSSFRPIQMVNAFKSIGYEVHLVSGYGLERKTAINDIKQRIKNGVIFDFLYAESSTMPTLLTEKSHLPSYPFMDFSFFKFCRKNGIKIGLFYRDIFWKFPIYRNEVGLTKYLVAKFFYRYDLYQYKKNLSVLFLPSRKVSEKFPEMANISRIEFLPPATNQLETKQISQSNVNESEAITIFYVGGISGNYDITKLLEASKQLKNINTIVCCRKKDWEESKHKYQDALSDNVEIVHLTGNDLVPYYEKADIFSCFLGNNEYMDIAMPVKLFQYLSYRKPIVTTRGTAAGDFVEDHSIGWNINYDTAELVSLLQGLLENKELLNSFDTNLETAYSANTWESRATKVATLLSRNQEN